MHTPKNNQISENKLTDEFACLCNQNIILFIWSSAQYNIIAKWSYTGAVKGIVPNIKAHGLALLLK